jgi:hypothetical protein
LFALFLFIISFLSGSPLLSFVSVPVPPPPPVLQIFLFVENFEFNPYAVEAFCSFQLHVHTNGAQNAALEVVDTVTILLGMTDICDGIKNLFSASMVPGGTGIVVMAPTNLTAFRQNAASIHALEGHNQDEAALHTHLIQNTLMNQPSMPRSLTKTFMLMFPPNIICETAIFNNGGNTKLTSNFCMMQVNTGRQQADSMPLYSHVSYVFWKLAIQGTHAVVTRAMHDLAARPDIDDIIASMNNLGVVV